MNVVLIVLDSLRPDHVGCYGNDWIKTPHLDGLANDGVTFTRAYPDSLPTLPARRAIYTGTRIFPFEHHKHLKGDFVASPGWGPIREEIDTISEIFQKNRYNTCLISDVYHQFKPGKNFSRGFNQWTFIRGQESDPYRSGPWVSQEKIEKHMPVDIKQPFLMKLILKQHLMNTQDWKSEEDHFAPQVFSEAIKWLKQNKDGKSFFLTIESFDPHEPWDPPVNYRKLYDQSGDEVRDVIASLYGPADQYTPEELRRLRANYAGEVTMVDHWLGKFLETLDDLKLADDTLIVAVSDHGHCIGEHGLVSKQGYPMSREIADLVFLMRFPGKEYAGTKCEKFAYHHDIPVTILKTLGITVPKNMEGIDLKPAIEGKVETRPYVTTGFGPFVMVRDDRYWYNAYLWGDLPKLFDMEVDPELKRDISADNPEIVEKMAELAIKDAKGVIPDYIRKMAKQNLPGCTPMEPSLEVKW